MKISTAMMAMGLTLLAAPTMAHDKNPFADNGEQYQQQGDRADFLGLKDTFYVKTDKGVQKASRLSQGEQLVTEAGEPFATVTGKLVVKLKPGVDAAAFAADSGLRLDWQNDTQLLVLAASEGSDLLAVLEKLKRDPQVMRVKLDRAVLKHEPM
ncbi:hypothetical protein TUM17387_26640 [Shewanella carassii]|uniref:hypothetical protein n=1 Tax=Shewanella carassii TaxID=1987584 RepID=UPI001BEE16E5|nr:hypothetical protein [Shewanella carassii]BCV67305.1 hypothetical protein TUM17387_26640 [Shewanella carassii]